MVYSMATNTAHDLSRTSSESSRSFYTSRFGRRPYLIAGPPPDIRHAAGPAAHHRARVVIGREHRHA